MNAAGWSIEQRMKLPDWSFGNKTLIGVYVYNNVPGSNVYGISEIKLPDPVCIWQFSCLNIVRATEAGYARAGLADTIPTNEAEMNEALDFYPYYGIPAAGPNQLPYASELMTYVVIPLRFGIVTGSKYLVVENHCLTVRCRIQITLLVSSLPTRLPGQYYFDIP